MKWLERDIDTVHDEQNIKGFFGDYRWLSNFEPCLVEFEGVVYPSSEAAYQAAKCRNKSDRILFVSLSASVAKKLGRQIPIVENWDEIKIAVMRAVLLSKFTKNSHLREKLIQTGNKFLEETNWWGDKFWGVSNGAGKNMLGSLLMEIRSELCGT